MNRRAALMALAFVAGTPTADMAAAQARYPERPIKLVVPFAPGGVADVVGRPFADRMKASIGPVFIEYQPGGGGVVGGTAVARANPDGHTILLGTAGQFLVPAASQSYDPIRDLEPISILTVAALAIAVHPSVPAANLKELIAYAKANPGKLSYGSAGVGSTTHLTGELFKALTETPDIVHVPYKGAGQMINDLVSGHIPLLPINVTGQVLELHQSGKLRLLALTTTTRLASAPEIPTAGESGLPGLVFRNFTGLFAPAGTPPAIVEQIAQVTHGIMGDQEFQQKLTASGFQPHLDSTPKAARRFIADEIDRLAPVIKAIGLKP